MLRDGRRTAFRLAVGVAVAAALLYGVGWEAVAANLARTDLVVFAPAVGFALLALLVGSEGFRIVFDLPLRGARASRARRAYLASIFVSSVLPAGNVGSSAFLAYTVREDSEDGVGGSVAAVAGWEFLNMVASVVVAAAGIAGIAASGGDTSTATVIVAVFATLLLGSALVLALFSTRREGVVSALVWLADLADRTVGRVVPTVELGRSRESVTAGLESFFEGIESIASDRRRLALAVVAAHLGWLFGALPLYFCLHAVGLPVSMAVVLVVIPLSGFSLAIPVPGGLGTMDAALGGLVALFTTYPLGALASAVVLYRLAKYPLQIVVGGAAMWTLDRTALAESDLVR